MHRFAAALVVATVAYFTGAVIEAVLSGRGPWGAL